jgi:hypothetical protein
MFRYLPETKGSFTMSLKQKLKITAIKLSVTSMKNCFVFFAFVTLFNFNRVYAQSEPIFFQGLPRIIVEANSNEEDTFSEIIQQESSGENLKQDESIDFGGELSFVGSFWQAPSSMKNQISFLMPWTRVSLDTDPWDKLHFHLVSELSPKNKQSEAQPSFHIRESYAEWSEPGWGIDVVKLGIMRNFLLGISDAQWDYAFLGNDFEVLSERFGYQKAHELTLSILKTVGHINFGFELYNDEGSITTLEQVPAEKTAMVFVDYLSTVNSLKPKFFFTLYGAKGSYEGIELNHNAKTRTGFSMGYNRGAGFGLILEGFYGEDPVDAINNKIAEAIDLTNYGGTVAQSRAQSGSLFYRTDSAFLEYFLRMDQLEPYLKDKSYTIRTEMGGVGYNPNPSTQIAIALVQTNFGEKHNISSRDSQKFVIGTKVKF